MKIAFLILAHNHPQFLAETAKRMLEYGHFVCIHYDTSAPKEERESLNKALTPYRERCCLLSEFQCAWGEWSLVQAPLHALKHIQSLNWDIDYVHFMSGQEVPIKPFHTLTQFLTLHPYDYIESVNITEERWVKGGLEIERLEYHFPYNFIGEREDFESHLNKQREAGLKRSIPSSITPHMGSQWWTLRWSSCEAIIAFSEAHPDIDELYKTSWIPDEGYFQTLIRSVIPDKEVISTQLLYHHLLLNNGRPMVFMNGHEHILKSLPHFFVRKVSSTADQLQQEILHLTSADCESTIIPSPEALIEAKEKQDAQIYKISTIREHTPWSDLNVDSKKYNKTEIIMLVHSANITSADLRETFKGQEHIIYLGRPFKKGHDYVSANIFDRARQKYAPKQPHIGQEEFINTVPYLAPHVRYVIFSYIPQFDWVDRHHFQFNCNLNTFLISSDTESIFDQSYLRTKLTFEKLESLKYALSLTLTTLSHTLKNAK